MIEARNVTKSFGPRTALAGVDLSIAEGELVTLVGPNGAGKTTLLRILATLSRPSSGTVRIGGLDTRRDGERVRAEIGFLSHQTLLYDELTGEQNLHFYACMYEVANDTARVAEILERVGLGMRRHDRVETFSRGMKQRLAVARAVLHHPRVLLLDEPYSGLDAEAADRLTELLVELGREGRTVLLATHRLGRGVSLGQRVLILHQGRVVYDQPRGAIEPPSFAQLYRAMTSQGP